MRWFTLILIGCVSVQATAADINVPADHATIQAAIVAAVNDDEIIVAPGTYFENINLLGKAVTVRSSDPTDPVVVMQTIIDGTGFDHVVQCVSGEGPDTVLSGFVITGGNDSFGGGMFNENSSPTVTNCSFSGNTASDDGGGMYNFNSSPTVSNCSFSGTQPFTTAAGCSTTAATPRCPTARSAGTQPHSRAAGCATKSATPRCPTARSARTRPAPAAGCSTTTAATPR